LIDRLFVRAVGGPAAEIVSRAGVNKDPPNMGSVAIAVQIHLVCGPVAVEDDDVLRVVGRVWPPEVPAPEYAGSPTKP